MKTFKKNVSKKLIVVFLLTSGLFTNTRPANALFGAGDIVFDIPNTVQGTISAISDVTTAATSIMQKINMILGPIADAMRLVQLAKSGNFIRNLVIGSTGTNPLLITNPQQYLKNIANKEINKNLKIVINSEGIYSNSIFGSIVNMRRYETDTKTTLKSLSNSSIPSIVQKRICDANNVDTITDLAGTDDPEDASTYNTRTEELYDKLCNGDPSEDPELAKVLTDLNSQRPEVGGWDTFLAKTSGDNTFTKRIKAEELIRRQQDEQVAAKLADYTMGNGIRSETECSVPEETDEEGGSYCPDGKEVITKLGSHLSETYNDALNSTNNVLRNSMGSNAAFALLVSNLSTLISTTRSTAALFSDVVNDPSQRRTVTTSGQIMYSTSTYTHTLTPGTGTAASITTNIRTLLNDDKTSLSTLQKVDSEFNVLVNDYISKLTTTKDCFDSLVQEFPDETIRMTHFDAISLNQTVINALTYLNSEISLTQPIKTQIDNDLSNISTMQTLISTTLDNISRSDSIEEITDLQDNYTETIRIKSLPTSQTSIERVQEKAAFQQKVGDGSRDKSVAMQKIDDLTSSCSSIGNAERSARNDARSIN